MPVQQRLAFCRLALLVAAALGVLSGPIGSRMVNAQSLDMDAGSGSPSVPKANIGGLDMDSGAAPSGAAQPAPQVGSRDSIRAGIVPLTGAPDNAPGIPPLAPQPATVVTEPAPTPSLAEPIPLDHPRVIDTAKLQSGDTVVSLWGIEGKGGAYAQGLQGFMASGDGRVMCQAQATAGFVCLMSDGTNIAQVALVNGAATTTPEAPESYREQESAAQAARRGIWVNLPPPPETVAHPVVRDTATLASGDGKTYVLDGVTGFQQPYAGQLQGYLSSNGDNVTCSPQLFPGRFICLLPDGTDVAKIALVNGAAQVGPDAPDSYRMQQLDALNNRRGYWATASNAVMTAALLPPEGQAVYALESGDAGVDGITYVGGAPIAMIEGQQVFFVYGDDDLGWGYYDHYHHWHGAPERFRHHLDHFHPGGHGLRGYDRYGRGAVAMREREGAIRREEAMRGREAAMHPGGFHPSDGGVHPGAFHPGEAGMHPGGFHPGEAGHPGMGAQPGFAGHPGMGAQPGFAGHPGVPAAPGMAGHPTNVAMAGHPGAVPAPAGFVHPGAAASAGGFHPAAPPAMHAPAPAMHASAPAVHASAPAGKKK